MRSQELNQTAHEPGVSDSTLREPSDQPPRVSASAPNEPAERANTQSTTQLGHTVKVYPPSKPKPEKAARNDDDPQVRSPPEQRVLAATTGRRPELLVVLLGAAALTVIAIILIRGKRAGL